MGDQSVASKMEPSIGLYKPALLSTMIYSALFGALHAEVNKGPARD